MTISRRLAARQVAWFDDWQLAAASTTGGSHLARATENQDAFQTNISVLRDPTRRHVTANEPLIICVADGVSANRNSAAGAALAAALGQNYAEAAFAGQSWNRLGYESLQRLLHTILRNVRESWLTVVAGQPSRSRAAHARHRTLRRSESANAADHFQTTFIVAVLRPPWLAVAQIGDGFVIAQDGEGKCHLLDSAQSNQEYANTVVTLGSRRAEARICLRYDRNIRGIAVSTDGLEDSVLNYVTPEQRAPKEDFFSTIFAEVGAGERDSERTLRLLRSPALRSQTDDDLTLVVASRADSRSG